MPRVTLQTIADRVGVSRMTVSNAFSRPDQLSTGLRERILSAAEELGYTGPDPAGRALARGTTGAVGIVLTESLRFAFTDLVATGFLGAIADALAPTGLALTLLSSTSTGPVIPARDIAIDGALIYACDPQSPAAAYLTRRQLPLVHVDQRPVPHISSVNIDDREGARAVARHVVDLGHRRVGLLLSGQRGPYGAVTDLDALDSVDGQPSIQRRLGWLDALTPAGITPTAARAPDAEPGHIGRAARLLLDRPDRPTAILCFSDAIAETVMHTATDLGLRVPDDVSVAGFDDNPLATRVRPALTTVRQDIEEKGRAAAAALTTAIQRHRAGGPAEPEHIVLPTRLVVRDSTAPPPG
jgi:DNA-binding LacI/PurR family transcriptional regulator